MSLTSHVFNCEQIARFVISLLFIVNLLCFLGLQDGSDVRNRIGTARRFLSHAEHLIQHIEQVLRFCLIQNQYLKCASVNDR